MRRQEAYSTGPYPATTIKWKSENTGGNAFSISSRSVTPFPACVCVLHQRPCVHYTELFIGFVGRSLTKPAQIVDIFLSAWDFSYMFISVRPKTGIFAAAVRPLSSGAWLPLNTTCTYTLLFIFPALCSLGEWNIIKNVIRGMNMAGVWLIHKEEAKPADERCNPKFAKTENR